MHCWLLQRIVDVELFPEFSSLGLLLIVSHFVSWQYEIIKQNFLKRKTLFVSFRLIVILYPYSKFLEIQFNSNIQAPLRSGDPSDTLFI